MVNIFRFWHSCGFLRPAVSNESKYVSRHEQSINVFASGVSSKHDRESFTGLDEGSIGSFMGYLMCSVGTFGSFTHEELVRARTEWQTNGLLCCDYVKERALTK